MYTIKIFGVRVHFVFPYLGELPGENGLLPFDFIFIFSSESCVWFDRKLELIWGYPYTLQCNQYSLLSVKVDISEQNFTHGQNGSLLSLTGTINCNADIHPTMQKRGVGKHSVLTQQVFGVDG